MSSTDEYPPAPVPALTPSLVTTLRDRTQEVLSYLVKTNSTTTYFNESEILSDFRNIIKLNGPSTTSFETFHENVPFSVYRDYLPFISRFSEQPCKMSSIENLMAPGFPELIAHSSGTSSGATKYFPKYRHPEHMSMSTSISMKISDPANSPGGKNCLLYSLRHHRVVEGLNDDGDVELKIPVCLLSAGTVRMYKNLHIDRDQFYQGLKISNQSSPLGVCYIANYKSFMFMHVLFALYEPKLEVINAMFITTFRDFCLFVDEKWDTFIECIEMGSIPDLDSVGDLKAKLEKYLPPNPQRAAELREIRQTAQSPGCLARIWPGLRYVLAISSGPFQTVVPEIRHYIGSDVELRPLSFNCSEAFVAIAYDTRDANLYKVIGSDDVIEFLPLDAPEESKYVMQSWNIEVGKKYEVVLTTRDGFWRYRLGDVVEAAGFDPRDGQPIIRYIERRGVHIRLANEFVTGQELLDALSSTSDSFGIVSEFCVSPDFRESIPRYGYFVELHGELGPSSTSVSQQLHEHLRQHNENYRAEAQMGKLAPPSVRVLRQGTFGEYREWKIRATGQAAGQAKVPPVVWDEKTRNWLVARVIQEF